MSGRLGNYVELVGEARKKRLEITRSQEKKLRGLYEEIAKELENSLKRYSPKTLTYRWLKDYSKTLRRESKTLYQTIEKKVSSSVLETAGAVTEAEQKFYAKACPILSERFSHVFSSIPAQVAEELMNGGIYRGFSGLSERIWQYEKQFTRDIQTIISRGILAQKPAYDLAKDLETYLRPEAKKPWDWGNVYPGVSRQVDYSAQRLARTAVTHAYQLSLERATKDNPFVEGYRWHSSNGGRVCPLCRERDGRLYEKDSLPLDHPNGMCVVTAEISKSYEEIGRELGDWAAGRNQDPALDRWLGNSPAFQETASVILEQEKKVIKEQVEKGFIFNGEGKILWQGTGSKKEVNVPPEERHLLKDNIFSHNHPGNGPLSPADIRNLWLYEMKEVRAATSHGVFSATSPKVWKKEPVLSEMNQQFNILANKFAPLLMKRVKNGIMDMGEADYIGQRLIMRRLTRKLGVKMELIPWE